MIWHYCLLSCPLLYNNNDDEIIILKKKKKTHTRNGGLYVFFGYFHDRLSEWLRIYVNDCGPFTHSLSLSVRHSLSRIWRVCVHILFISFWILFFFLIFSATISRSSVESMIHDQNPFIHVRFLQYLHNKKNKKKNSKTAEDLWLWLGTQVECLTPVRKEILQT